MSNVYVGERGASQQAPKSVPELAEEVALLEQAARRQLLDLAHVIDGQLQHLVAIYQRACGNVPRLHIESEILKARSLLGELKMLTRRGS